MGLFNFFTKKQKKITSEEIKAEMYRNNTMGYRDTKDRLDYQSNLLNKVGQANVQYKDDLKKLIEVYEFAFYKSDPPCVSSQNLKLVDMYIKTNQNDKAWGYLNFLYVGNHAPIEKIRFLQAKILKKENKHKYAIEMYMLGYLKKSEWNNTFQKDMFLKDITPSANKLNWDNEKKEYLAYLVENHVKQRNYNENILSDSYKKAIEDFERCD